VPIARRRGREAAADEDDGRRRHRLIDPAHVVDHRVAHLAVERDLRSTRQIDHVQVGPAKPTGHS